jgi:hypothetical protein
MEYTTREHVKAVLRTSATSDDLLIDLYIERASRLIDQYCRRRFYGENDTRTYDAVGHHISGALLLLDGDLLALTAVINGDGTIILPEQVLLRPLNMPPYFGIALKHESGLAWAYSGDPAGALRVTGMWGYSLSPPEVITQAAARLTIWLYQQRGAGAEVIGGEPNDLTPADHMPHDVRAMLRPYRRIVMKGAST